MTKRSLPEIAVLVVAVAAIAMTVFAVQYGINLARVNERATTASERLAADVTAAHLWLEEDIAGDERVQVDRQVFGNIHEAQRLARGLLRGGPSRLGVLPRSDDPVVRQDLGRLTRSLARFEELSQRRLEERSLVGSPAEQSFDSSFMTVQRQARAAHEHIEAMVARRESAILPFVWISAAILATMFGAVFWLVHKHRAAGRRSELFLDSIIDNIPDVIFVKDADGLRFVRLNRAGAEMLGETKDDLIGKTDYDFFPPEEADFFTTKDREVLTRDELLDIEEEPVHAPQGMRFHHTKKIPLTEEGGRARYLLGISRDVTARKQAEEALREARLAAEQASKAKSDFLATMSHEIRTPLTAVIGFARLLEGSDLDDRQRQYVQGMRSGGEMLMSVINDILDFSKIEAGRLELEVDEFDLRRLVDDTSDVVSEKAREKGLVVLAQTHPEVPIRVRGDAGRLGQVLMNLMGNAIKFTEEGEVVVRVLPEASEDERVRLRFEVQDTGVGIAPEHQAELFDAFRQVDSSSTRRHEGTGLGLAICRRLVELMDGDIGLRSIPGEGSTFWFTVALEPGRTRDDAELGPLADERALIAAEPGTHRLVVREVLSGLRMRVEVASGVAELSQKLLGRDAAGETHRVVVLDTDLLGEHGFELAHRLRSAPEPPSHIILCSSSDGAAEQGRAEAIGASLLRKPVRQTRLLDVLSAPAENLAGRPAPSGPGAGPLGRALLAEDNPANQLVQRHILEGLGFIVDTVSSGIEAIEAVAARPYRVVLMDCRMPGMDGYEATQKIRAAEEAGSRIPIIAITASAMQSDRDRCLAVGMDDYLAKPIRPEQLRRALERFGIVAPESGNGAPVAGGAEQSPVPDARVIDLRRWRSVARLGTARAKLVDTYVGDAAVRVDELRAALLVDDREGAERIAHTLKSSSELIGATRVASLCREIERRCMDRRIAEARDLLSELAEEFGRARAALIPFGAQPAH